MTSMCLPGIHGFSFILFSDQFTSELSTSAKVPNILSQNKMSALITDYLLQRYYKIISKTTSLTVDGRVRIKK